MDVLMLKRNRNSCHKIARTLGMHRKIVKQHLEQGAFLNYRNGARWESILAPYYQMIRDFLEEDGDYQATWIFERLKKAGYYGSYGIRRNYVRMIKEQESRLAYIRFETEPGRQAQCD